MRPIQPTLQGRAARPQARVQLDTGKPYGAVLAPILPVTGPVRLVRVADWPLFRVL